ncbi:MAG TPA: hypothetical protein VFW64_09820 [Pseudonocardiaceae bacterium]|nr:hypothetical protein [Pseudonocardiaceae bacterium]
MAQVSGLQALLWTLPHPMQPVDRPPKRHPPGSAKQLDAAVTAGGHRPTPPGLFDLIYANSVLVTQLDSDDSR